MRCTQAPPKRRSPPQSPRTHPRRCAPPAAGLAPQTHRRRRAAYRLRPRSITSNQRCSRTNRRPAPRRRVPPAAPGGVRRRGHCHGARGRAATEAAVMPIPPPVSSLRQARETERCAPGGQPHRRCRRCRTAWCIRRGRPRTSARPRSSRIRCLPSPLHSPSPGQSTQCAGAERREGACHRSGALQTHPEPLKSIKSSNDRSQGHRRGASVEEPIVDATIICPKARLFICRSSHHIVCSDAVRHAPCPSAPPPQDCVGPLVELCVERRGSQLEHTFLARHPQIPAPPAPSLPSQRSGQHP